MPLVLLEAQFELLMATFCLVFGPASALNFVRPTSLAALFPPEFLHVYGITLTAAGLAIGWGLRRGVPQWPVCSGLNLLGVAVVAYAVAIVAVLGLGGAGSAGLFVAVGLLAWLRSFTISTSLREKAALAREARQ